jgi:hypothetical protein
MRWLEDTSSLLYKKASEITRPHQPSLLREAYDNPFRPVTFYPSWRTDTAASLARQMYDARDFSAMPIICYFSRPF